MSAVVHVCDCLDWMRDQHSNIFDVAITSPPYQNKRTYGIKFVLKGQAWVDWMLPSGVKGGQYQPCVEWLISDLTRNCGMVCGPSPYCFHRIGIPGSGARTYHRRDWEPVYGLCFPSKFPLKFTNNTATGHAPLWAPGGAMSNRNADGLRKNRFHKRNQWGGSPSQREAGSDGNLSYRPPVIANSGNVIKCNVGGGHMGNKLASENEAPFPETLVEFFMVSYCPIGGTAFDPFCGSGTVLAVAERLNRNSVGCDVRESQAKLTRRRLKTVQKQLPFSEGVA
jgi:hypothetical protein